MNYTAEEKEKIIKMNLLNKVPVKILASNFKVTQRSIYRWIKLYDGTLKSLENGLCLTKTPHPKTLSKEEVTKLKILFKDFPFAKNAEIAKLLGTHRDPVTISRYRKKLIQENKKIPKNNILSIFNKLNLNHINKEDIYNCKDDEFWLIEINNVNIFIAKENGTNPCGFTPFFSIAMKFSNENDVLNYIKVLNNTTDWILTPRNISRKKILNEKVI